jgi:hypothetical protein
MPKIVGGETTVRPSPGEAMGEVMMEEEPKVYVAEKATFEVSNTFLYKGILMVEATGHL